MLETLDKDKTEAAEAAEEAERQLQVKKESAVQRLQGFVRRHTKPSMDLLTVLTLMRPSEHKPLPVMFTWNQASYITCGNTCCGVYCHCDSVCDCYDALVWDEDLEVAHLYKSCQPK